MKGDETTWTANVVVNCGGQFSRPKYANIPGKDTFAGQVIHTAQWPENVDLAGKRVAMIGTGPSTGQVAPSIQPIVKQLYIYQRSATYVLPRNDGPEPEWKQKLFTLFPPFLWLYHVWLYINVGACLFGLSYLSMHDLGYTNISKSVICGRVNVPVR